MKEEREEGGRDGRRERGVKAGRKEGREGGRSHTQFFSTNKNIYSKSMDVYFYMFYS